MTCEQFRNAIVSDDPTELADAERHAAGCADCGPSLNGDRRLACAVRQWVATDPSPSADLERRIAVAIEQDNSSRRGGVARRHGWWVAVAASMLLALWFAPQLWTPAGSSLSEVAQLMAEADRARDRYIEMIAALERQATPILQRAGDPELPPARAANLLRYRDRLLHLDSVIAEVQLFLDENPGHSGGHTVLLAAYQEKQQVLGELIEIQLGEAS